MRNNGTFLCKALYVGGFFTQEALRDEQREVGIHVTRVLEHPVQRIAHVFPDRKAVRLYDHAPFNG